MEEGDIVVLLACVKNEICGGGEWIARIPWGIFSIIACVQWMRAMHALMIIILLPPLFVHYLTYLI